jgi:hypothetical protein
LAKLYLTQPLQVAKETKESKWTIWINF